MSLPSWFDGFASFPDALPRHEGIQTREYLALI